MSCGLCLLTAEVAIFLCAWVCALRSAINFENAPIGVGTCRGMSPKAFTQVDSYESAIR